MTAFRNMTVGDFDAVAALLLKCGVEPPELPSDLFGPGVVAERDGKIVGCVWALAGASSRAYVDYWAVSPEVRGGAGIAVELIGRLERVLSDLGVRSYMFHVEKHNCKVFLGMFKHRVSKNLTLLREMHCIKRVMA